MPFRVTFQFRFDDPTTGEQRLFSRENVMVTLAQVPQIGEAVIIPTNGPGATSLGARRVVDVIYRLDGGLILRFDLDGLANGVDEQAAILLSAGFVG